MNISYPYQENTMVKKIKFRCAIYMARCGVNIFSNYPKTFDLLNAGPFINFIPEYSCSKIKVNSGYSIIYIKDKVSSAKMLDSKTLEIRGPLKEIMKASTIPYRAHFMIEPQLNNNSIFTTQGAGVSKDQKAILLMGKGGSGKTSISLELCRKYNFDLIGNDLVLVGLKNSKGYLFGGTKVFPIRFTTVKYYNEDLQKYFENTAETDEWINKINLYPKDLAISIEKKLPVKMIKAFYIHLDNNKSAPLHVQKIGKKGTLYMGSLFLYEELSRYIRGVCNQVVMGPRFNLVGYLPSLDTDDYHKKRIRLINWLLNNFSFYYISGPMKSICDYFSNCLETSNAS